MKHFLCPLAVAVIVPALAPSASAGLIWRSALDGNATTEVGVSGTAGGGGLAVGTEDKNGNLNGALLFDGASYFDIGRLGPLNAGTISIWLRQDEATGERGVVGVGASGAGTDVYFSFMSAAGRIRGDLDDGALRRDVLNNGVLFIGDWYHIVITFDSRDDGSQLLRVYQDGFLQTEQQSISGDIAPYTMTHNGVFGSERTTERFWVGALDDLRIYDQELTQEEVTALFEAGPQFGSSGDLDGDGLPDTWEEANGTSPTDNGTGNINNGPAGDPDGDGLTNLQEFQAGTRADLADTDGDGLRDDYETKTGTWVSATNTGTNPLNPDTDGDGLSDGVENNTGTFVSATQTGSSPLIPDSDGDTMPDGFEVTNLLNPSDPADAAGDPDNDLSINADEYARGTRPQIADTDGDGLRDGVETLSGFWTSALDTGTNPLARDSDGDRLSDGVETNTGIFVSAADTGTDPNGTDHDFDGFSDQTEVVNGSDPTKADSVPENLVETLFIGANATANLGADGAVLALLQDHFGVDAITYLQATAAFTGSEEGFDLVFLSSSPASGDIRYKFQGSLVPVVNYEEAIADNGDGEFGFTTAILTKSTTITQLALEPHPVTNGLPAVITLFTGLPVETTCTGALFPGITVIGSAVDGTDAGGASVAGFPMVYVAEAGESIAPETNTIDGVVPSRRVHLPFTDSTFNTLSTDGRQLVLNAVDWAVGRLGTPVEKTLFITGLSVNAAQTELTLTWNSDATPGITYDILSSSDPALPLNTWTVAATGITATGTSTSSTVAINPTTTARLFFAVRQN